MLGLHVARRRIAASIANLHRERYLKGGMSNRDYARLAWLKFCLVVMSREFITLVFFGNSIKLYMLFTYDHSDPKFYEFLFKIAMRFFTGMLGVCAAFVVILFAYGKYLSDFDQKRLFHFVYLAVMPLSICLFSTSFFMALSELHPTYIFDFFGEFKSRLPVDFILALLLFTFYGKAISYHHYVGSFMAPLIVEKVKRKVQGDLILLQAQREYVRVVTTKGEDTIRIKFSDAIEETSPVDGVQVHRSFWVANNFLGEPYRKDRRWFMDVEGEQISVSSDYAARASERTDGFERFVSTPKSVEQM